MDIIIRDITISDVESFGQLYLKLDTETIYRLFEPGEREDWQCWAKKYIENVISNPKENVIVAQRKDTGELIGYLSVNGRNIKRVAHVGTIAVAILQEYVGLGIGERIFRYLEEWALLNNIYRLDLTVMENNPKAFRFYKKIGFKEEGTKRKSMFVDGQYINEFYMSKLLFKNKLQEEFNSNLGKLYTEAVCAVNDFFIEGYGCENDRMFDLASISKLVTTTFILKLITDGKISLETKLIELFDNIVLGQHTISRFKNICIKDLLIHHSGIVAWYPFYTVKGDFWDVLEYVLSTTDIQTETVYSDINYLILGELVKKITSKSLSENLKELNEKIGTNFCYNPLNKQKCSPTELRGNQIEKNMCKEKGFVFENFRDLDTAICGEVNDGNCYYFFKGESGHAGIFGTASDLIALGKLYLNCGNINGKMYLDNKLCASIFSEEFNGRTLGFHFSPMFPGGIGHTGFTGTSLFVSLQNKKVVVILTNRLNVKEPPNLAEFRKFINGLALQIEEDYS